MDGPLHARIFLRDDKYGFEVWFEGLRPHHTAHCFETLDECITYFDMRNERVWEVAPENHDGTVLTSCAYKEGSVPWRLEQEKGSFRGRLTGRGFPG